MNLNKLEYKFSNRDKRQEKEQDKRQISKKFFCSSCDTPLVHRKEKCPRCGSKNRI